MRTWFNNIQKTDKNTPLPVLQKCGMLGVLVLFLLSALTVNLGTDFGAQFELMLSAVLPGVVVNLTNEERREHDLSTLARSPLLDEAARLKAEHMRDNDYFAHFSPEGISPWYWFDEVGYDYIHAGENLAVFFDESDDVVEAWMDSPLHRDNILKREYTEIGLAVVEAEHEGYSTFFIVQLFGTPAPKPTPAVRVTEEVHEQDDTAIPIPAVEVETTATAPTLPIQEEYAQKNNELPDSSEEDLAIERISVADKTVFVTNHEATTTIPVTLGTTNAARTKEDGEGKHYPRPQTPKNTITIFYILVALLSISLVTVSITHATKHAHYAHAVYGTALLFVTAFAILFHSYVVQAIVF